MTNRADIIYSRLKEAFVPTYLEVKDDSDQHIGHAGHQGGQRHFTITITASCFDGVSKVEAHRKIYALFADMIPEQIHALRIKILS